MEEFLQQWGYLGVFLGILSTGIPFVPLPEELPVVIGGVLVGNGSANWMMLPVCIVAVIIGDAMLYGVGRWSGPWLLNSTWIQKYVLPPERRRKIEENFQKHGIKILLFARLTPGIRAPIFVMAGITKLPLPRFILADGIYAVPGVALLFFLGYWFTGSIVTLIKHDFEHVKHIIILVVIVGVVGYFTYKFLRRPMVTGDPKDIPPLVEKVTHTLEGMTHTLEQATSKIFHPTGGKASQVTMKIEPGQVPGQDAKSTAATDGQAGIAEPTKPHEEGKGS
jgi:membrane protein DedA with SNARE-associated domain